MALVIGIFLSLLFGFIAALPAIIFKKVKKVNLTWAQKACFLFLAYFIYNIIFILLTPETSHHFRAPVIGYIMFWFIINDTEDKEDKEDNKKPE